LASAKDGAGRVFASLKNSAPIRLNLPDFESKIVSIKPVLEGIYLVQVHSPYYAHISNPGQIFRFQTSGFAKPVPLTLAFKTLKELHFYVEVSGDMTSEIVKLAASQAVYLLKSGSNTIDFTQVKNIRGGGARYVLIGQSLSKFYEIPFEIYPQNGLFLTTQDGILRQNSCEMQCMMRGVCGRCIEIKDGLAKFNCQNEWI
jgi:hypothetical protein